MSERERVLRQIDAAFEEAVAISRGDKKWRMRVPVDPEDSDEVIVGALRAARAALECAELAAPDFRWATTAERAAFRPTTVLCARCGRDFGSVYTVRIDRDEQPVAVCERCGSEVGDPPRPLAPMEILDRESILEAIAREARERESTP